MISLICLQMVSCFFMHTFSFSLDEIRNRYTNGNFQLGSHDGRCHVRYSAEGVFETDSKVSSKIETLATSFPDTASYTIIINGLPSTWRPSGCYKALCEIDCLHSSCFPQIQRDPAISETKEFVEDSNR